MAGREDDGLALEATTPAAAVDATIADGRTVASGDAGPPAKHAPGTKIGRYAIAGVLGSGGMGVVYRAFDPQLGRPVALKVVRPGHGSEETRERLIREAQAMAKLAHPNVIAVHDAGSVDDEVFVAMELVDGENLATWLETPRSWRDKLAMFEQAARGLAAAHAAGLVHRDFKPLNVLVGKDGRVRVLDFGLARPMDAAPETGDGTPSESLSLTRTGAIVGTPLYMPAEQLAGGPTDARTDQFAFCVALFHALYGAYPFAGASLGELMASVTAGEVVVPVATHVPIWLRRIVLRGLSVRPDARFESIEALLDKIAEGLRRRRRAYVASVAVIAIGAALAGVIVLRPGATVPLPPFAQAKPQQITFRGDASAPSLSHDGRRLAYRAGSIIGYSDEAVIVEDLATGSSRILDATSNTRDVRWSPDDTALLSGNQNGAWVTPANGGDVRIYGGCPSNAWSPDGRTILQRCHPGKTWSFVDVATGARRERELALPDADYVIDVDWSSRDLILATAIHKGSTTLWTFRPDGGELREAFSATDLVNIVAGHPRWNGAGDRIYLLRTRGQIGEIAVLAFDSSSGRATEVGTVGLGRAIVDDDRFAISADETTMITSFSTKQTDVVMTRGDVRKQLTHDTEPKAALHASRDGSRLAFASNSGTRTRIHVMTLAGQPVATLPSMPGEITDLAWSPDGRTLVYALADQDTAALWRVDLTSEATTKLLDGAYANIAWSSAGPLVLTPDHNTKLIELDPETGARRDLFDIAASFTLVFAPRVSPDGKRLLASRNVDGHQQVWLVDLDGSHAEPFFGGTGFPVGWSPDGRTAYIVDQGNDTEVIAIDTATRATRVALRTTHAIAEVEPVADGWLAIEDVGRSDLWAWSTRAQPIALPTNVAPAAVPTDRTNPEPIDLAFDAGLRDGVPIGWYAQRLSSARISPVEHAGRHALEVQAPSRLDLIERIDATAYRGKRIAVRFEALMDRANVVLRVDSIVHGRSVRSGETEAAPGGWSTLEASADIRPDADSFEIALQIRGTAWIANGSLEIVP